MANFDSTTDYPVHLGFWTNWSHGRITGATLTLSHLNGAFLTAFLAIFVTIVGTSFWRVACFTIHQFFSTSTPQDGLYHQRQAVLRNAANQTTGLESLIRIFSAWRRKANGPYKRIFPLLGFALMSMAAFAAAGIFSSKIGQMGNEVLISSPSCGVMNSPNGPDPGKVETISKPFGTRQLTSYANYAQRCYSETSSTFGNCGPFVKSKLPSTIIQNASCPFDEALCRRQDSNIKIETHVDSHSDLGLNAPPELRYTTKIVTHCAPLVTEGHKETHNLSDDISYTRYFYGATTTPTNYSYQYEQRSWAKWKFERLLSAFADYKIFLIGALATNNTMTSQMGYIPMDGLSSGDGDMSLMFLSANDIMYVKEVDDDWYSAHQTGPNHNLTIQDGDKLDGFTKMYMSDEPASALGCKFQYQACDTKGTNGECSRPGGILDLASGYLTPTKGGEVIEWVWSAPIIIPDIISALTITSLTSRSSLDQSVSGPLPTNQWQNDVENWHNITLANLQGGVILNAAGPGDAGILQYFWRYAQSDSEKYFCKNQKILSTAYSNFSLLWLVIILVIGSLIISLDFTLVSFIAWVDKLRKINQYSRLEWFTNDLLQLQRLAHEELEYGTWGDCAGAKAVPVTEKDEFLAVLDMDDPSHPRLKERSGLGGKVILTSTTQSENSENSDLVNAVEEQSAVRAPSRNPKAEKASSTIEVRETVPNRGGY